MQISVHMEDSLNTRQKCSSGIDRIQNLTPFQYHCVETSSCSHLCYRLCILSIRVYVSFLISVSFSRWSALWLTSQYFLNSCYVILIPNCTDPPTFNSLLNWVAEKYWKCNQIWIFLYKEAEGIVRRRRGWRTEAYLSICRWQAVSLCVRERWFLTAPDAGEDLISGYTFSVPVSCWFVTHTHISPVLCFFSFCFSLTQRLAERKKKKKRFRQKIWGGGGESVEKMIRFRALLLLWDITETSSTQRTWTLVSVSLLWFLFIVRGY